MGAAAILLTGCVASTKREVRAEAVAQCERKGKKFVESELVHKGGMFGTLNLAGECIGPDDPRYGGAAPAP